MMMMSKLAVLRGASLVAARTPGKARSLSAFIEKNEVAERIMDVLKNYDKVEAKLVTPTVAFKDLSLDSLDVVEVVMAIEEEFAIEIPDLEADKIATVNDAVEYVSGHPHAK